MTGDQPLDPLRQAAHGQRLEHQLAAEGADQAEEVALLRRGVGRQHQVRGGESEEVEEVAVGDVGGQEQLPQRAGRRRDGHPQHRVGRLGGGDVVGARADAADLGQDAGELLHRPADAEALEPAQLHHLQVGVGHVAVVVEEDLDDAVPLEPGDGVDADLPAHDALLPAYTSGVPQVRRS